MKNLKNSLKAINGKEYLKKIDMKNIIFID